MTLKKYTLNFQRSTKSRKVPVTRYDIRRRLYGNKWERNIEKRSRYYFFKVLRYKKGWAAY